MGADEARALFKAAKAQRGGGASLSKEHLKQLRAQKAASSQQAAQAEDAQRLKAAAAAAAAQARHKTAAGMPPPAPRAPSGSLPASTNSKAAISSSAGKPQSAIIRPSLQTTGQRSVNGAAQEPAQPSGEGAPQPALSSDSQQAQWRHGAADKQSTASTSDIQSHRQGGAAPASSNPAASSLLAVEYGSDEDRDQTSIQASAATAAEARDSGAQSANGLPSNFFEAAGSTVGDTRGSGSQRAERALSMESAASASLPTAAIPKGFFENKEADAKARGQKLPKKKDPKQEYDNFLQSIAEDVQEVEARQEVEAVEAAQDKADQEAFEHGLRLRRIEELRAMSTGPSTAASQTSSPDGDTPGAAAISIGSVSSVVPASKKRKRNASVEVDKLDDDDSSDDDGDDVMLDWRAKTF